MKLQNFILFICSKEKVSSIYSARRTSQRLQRNYENFLKDICARKNISQQFNFVTKSMMGAEPSSSRHMSHYYTMLAHGLDLQTMNSL
jgi:uncharacterized protein with von Willebrand factor type A (vWA) domain